MSDATDADSQFADLFDALLEEVLEGRQPDLQAMAAERPEIAERLDRAWALACSVAGRREPGRPTLGGYEILRELGRGGMGTVYLARQEALDREVAIKVLPHSLGLSGKAKRRFLEEARALARLHNDHIVRIHRVIDHQEMLAFEMEYVDGPSLTQALDALRPHGRNAGLGHLAAALGTEVGTLGARTLVEYWVLLGIRIARALDEVHRNGLIHRDVKPSNILLRRDGRPLLADFGLARDLDLSVTRAGSFAGTPVYSSPEQLRGEQLDPRADVYSLAITLYEAIALVPPLSGRSTSDMLRRIEDGLVPPLRRHAPHVARDLETILQKALERLPKDRYASAGAFADDLERLLQLQPIHARPVGLLRRTAKFAHRQRRSLCAFAVGAALVMAAMVPVLDHVMAAGTAKERVAALSRQARLRLLSPDTRHIGWHEAVWGRGPRLRRLVPGATGPVESLTAALHDYAAALALEPDQPGLRVEHDVVRLALWLRTESPQRGDRIEEVLAGPGFARATEGVPPLTKGWARALVGGGEANAALAALTDAAPPDRLALGLLAFLLGDFAVCERSWADLGEQGSASSPLLDAGLGILYQSDGRSDRAYVRLFHAVRAFPQAEVLRFELADAALALGDLQPARNWLLERPGDETTSRRRLRADLLAAEGDTDAATAAIRRLCADDPTDPIPRHRLLQLAMNRGDLREARAVGRELLASWPDVARFRLDVARLTLQGGDVPGYLAQVRYVLTHDFGRRSRGTVTDLLEILRIGGLRQLHDRAARTTGEPGGSRWTGFERPARQWAPAPIAACLEDHLLAWARLDESLRDLPADSGPTSVLARSAEALRALVLGVPGLPLVLGPRWTLLAAASPLAADLLTVPVGYAGYALHDAFDPRAWRTASPLDPGAVREANQGLTLGGVLATAGDLDGDGVADLLCGSPPEKAEQGPGTVHALSGRTGRVLHRARLEPDAGNHLFGFAVTGLADADGDGVPDWAVGAPVGREGHFGPGLVELRSGRTGAVLRTWRGDHPGFGVAIAGLGDVDDDGAPELAVGTSPDLRNSTAQGSVQVFSTRTGQRLYEVHSDHAGVWFGSAVGNAGDVDGDGRDDLIVGGNHGGAPGLVKVLAGRDGRVLLGWLDEAADTGFGRAVIGGGDLDGDGHADLLVSADGCGGQREGSVIALRGADGGVLWRARTAASDDGFGRALASIPDADGDGIRDVAVGAPYGGPLRRGSVWLRSGRTGEALGGFHGPFSHSLFGGALTFHPATGSPDHGRAQLLVSCPRLGLFGRVLFVTVPIDRP